MAPVDDSGTGAEQARVAGFGQLADGLLEAGDWYRWGPYLSERQWGTVREDYSADGEAWTYFPHDHARSRAYRWGEDGMAGFSDIEQRLCLGLALWNGNDAILKERMFGLTGAEGNHGEDPKDYWWYLDSVPSHAWNRWRYHYPQSAFPYGDLVEENGRRGKHDPEYELLDTGAFDDDRYWVVEVDYVKADVDDIVMVVRATNAGPDAATLHVLPTAWFRNTWSWEIDAVKPTLRRRGDGVVAIDHPIVGPMELVALPGPDGADPVALFCDNETNDRRVFGSASGAAHPKDGINDHVVSGAPTVNPDETGTKVSLWYQLDVAAGATAEVRLRLRPAGAPDIDVDAVIELRRREADEFYAALTPPDRPADEAMVMRQAFAGMLWGKQLYAYDVDRWLAGDPGQPPPPASRRSARNARWTHFEAFDIMSMPDPWEYPWFAAWDLGFHSVALAHLDPEFAKYQLLLLCREWFQHPNGALPAYEWDFGDVNPPVQAWAALEVFAIDGAQDIDFLERVFDKLLVNFTWWVNLEDADGSNLFEGGFLGLDNIGPIDRSHLPVGGRLEQSDATGWMAFYALTMATIASVLNRSGTRSADDLVVKFLEHFAAIRRALEATGVWDEEDGFFYDQLIAPDGTISPVKVRSMVGVIPLLAAISIDQELIDRAKVLGKGVARLLDRFGGIDGLAEHGLVRGEAGKTRVLLGVTNVDAAGAGAGTTVRSGRVPLAVRPAGLVGLAPRPSVPTRRRRCQRDDRLRARRVDHLDVRRQLELARPDLDASQLPRDRCDRAVRPLLRGRVADRIPDRERCADGPHGDRRRPPATSHRAVHGRAGRQAAVLRSGRSAAARSALVRQHRLQRVLPRRRRRRSGRHPPDRLDRPRGRPDPRPSWRRGLRQQRSRPCPARTPHDLTCTFPTISSTPSGRRASRSWRASSARTRSTPHAKHCSRSTRAPSSTSLIPSRTANSWPASSPASPWGRSGNRRSTGSPPTPTSSTRPNGTAGTTDLQVYKIELWAKYSGTVDYDQPHHRDFGNHNLVVPRTDGRWPQLTSFILLSDVTEEDGPTRVVPRAVGDREPMIPSLLEPGCFADDEVPVIGPAGTLFSYTTDVFHRGSAMTGDERSRFALLADYSERGNPWMGKMSWPNTANDRAWVDMITRASVRERDLFGFPPPGHAYWNDQTFRDVGRRYPGMDMEPYIRATG